MITSKTVEPVYEYQYSSETALERMTTDPLSQGSHL